MKLSVALVAVVLAAGCGGSSAPSTLTQPTTGPTPTHTNTPVPPKDPGVHFDTPEAAMKYLATAWNTDDLTSLKHVTDPAARTQLLAMHHEASNLSLNHCTFNKDPGDYTCEFDHDYPVGYKTTKKHGKAVFTVGPADKPGWYMTFFESCG